MPKKTSRKSAASTRKTPSAARPRRATEPDVYVSIIMGSDSDFNHMREAGLALKEMGVAFEMMVLSAHRTPEEMALFAKTAHERGIRVIIAGAGGAAHLPGMVAAYSPLPVIGVPIPSTVMNGVDSLHSIVQMPKGVPVATVAIGNAFNAGILAVQILAFGGQAPSQDLAHRLIAYKEYLREIVSRKQLPKI